MSLSKKLTIAFLVLTIIGFIDAVFLTVEHYIGVIPPCGIVEGCSTVLTSKWSILFGVPISLIGAINYLLLFVITLASLTSHKQKLAVFAACASAIGFAVSLWLVGLQLFSIKQICLYCMTSAGISTALFVVGVYIVRLSVLERKINNVV